jgi:diguanylate cyclase (GGDEF)-like protein
MIWAAEALTLGALLWSRWFYERDAFYSSWGGGFALHGLGVALVALRGDIPDFVSIQIANTMILAGTGCWIAGLLQFDGKPVDAHVAIPALIWIAGMFLYPIRESFANRTALANACSMIGYGIMIAVLLSNRESISKTTRRFLAACVSVQFAANGLISVLAIAHRPTSFAAAPAISWFYFSAAFSFIAGTMAGAKLLSERSEDKLKALALTDPLTCVLNRRGLIGEFEELTKRKVPEKPLIALLHFDLDRFKQINDRCGHQAGDAVLIAFSQICKASLRGRGFFGRMGGEEFAAVLRASDLVEAASIAEAIRLTVKRHVITVGEHPIMVTVSVGISLTPAENADLDGLLSSADRALYHAKESGRDRTAIDTGTEASIIPAIDERADFSQDEVPPDTQASRHVAALKRLALFGKH